MGGVLCRPGLPHVLEKMLKVRWLALRCALAMGKAQHGAWAEQGVAAMGVPQHLTAAWWRIEFLELCLHVDNLPIACKSQHMLHVVQCMIHHLNKTLHDLGVAHKPQETGVC